MFVFRTWLAPILLLVLLAPVRAEDEPSGDGWIDLAGATVVASPGLPEAAHDHLPGGQVPKPLTWPLPDGPLLVLGLPDRDEVAADLARLWGLLPRNGDLHGGYVVQAWHDGKRPVAAIFAEDGVALRVACEGLASPLRVRARRHHERPHYRVRALHNALGSLEEDLQRAIQARANRLWLDLDGKPDDEVSAILPRLARYGIEPVLVASDVPDVEERVTEGLRRHGVPRVALWLGAVGAREPTDVVRALQLRIRREKLPLRELIAVPISDEDSLAARGRGHPDLGGIQRTVLGWVGKRPCRAAVTLADARSIRDRTGAPVLFVEGWARLGDVPWDDPREAPCIPTRPRNRDPRLGDVLDGIVVLGGRGAELGLREAWFGPPQDRRDAWETHLLPLLPRMPTTNAHAFYEQSAKRLREAARAADAPPWMAPLATWLAAQAPQLSVAALGVPRIPAEIVADGVLDEAAWAYAARRRVMTWVPGPRRKAVQKEFELLAFANGRDLFVAVRSPAVLGPVVLGLGLDEVDTPNARIQDGVRTCEWKVEAHRLGEDAYPPRRIDIRLRTDQRLLFEDPLVLMP